MPKNKNKLASIFTSILVVASISTFILSYYVDWIDTHYSKILSVGLILTLINMIVYFNKNYE